ncbi:phosphoglycerate kinase [Oceanidesulfovibrio marinus]|uniref:Phosphoglycerate kinase n=2 Tax=Oceanidesulfovibrio marinus TaxID=370038 RepID=A0A6P1ZK11_9BACT|nr:phosphoglycerate kinase [Oceanidesulfovibrio marinus]TVM36051.1 phosphoglycerate kinase [Oceanidesulfovibrio marinus]
MEVSKDMRIHSFVDFDYRGKTVILRLDINCPVDADTGKLRNTNRIDKSVGTLVWLLRQGAKIAIIAHQGDSQDYKGLIPMAQHAQRLSELAGCTVDYIDDVCGPAAQAAVKSLNPGQAVLLGNLRYLAEEISAFEFALKVSPGEYLNCYLVRSLAPLADAYVNDAFSAAHRNSPSQVAFQELLPAAAGELLFSEVDALSHVLETPAQPAVYLLGGNRISDAYGMMGEVLSRSAAQTILTCGVTGLVMMQAKGVRLGANAEKYILDRGYDSFLPQSLELLEKYGDYIHLPLDVAYEKDGARHEIAVGDLPLDADLLDIGEQTIAAYEEKIVKAGTVFVNGPPGVYENPLFERGSRALFTAIQNAPGYTVIGGGDSVSCAASFIDMSKIGHVCTAGGAMVQYLSGKTMPLLAAMEKAYAKNSKG